MVAHLAGWLSCVQRWDRVLCALDGAQQTMPNGCSRSFEIDFLKLDGAFDRRARARKRFWPTWPQTFCNLLTAATEVAERVQQRRRPDPRNFGKIQAVLGYADTP